MSINNLKKFEIFRKLLLNASINVQWKFDVSTVICFGVAL